MLRQWRHRENQGDAVAVAQSAAAAPPGQPPPIRRASRQALGVQERSIAAEVLQSLKFPTISHQKQVDRVTSHHSRPLSAQALTSSSARCLPASNLMRQCTLLIRPSAISTNGRALALPLGTARDGGRPPLPCRPPLKLRSTPPPLPLAVIVMLPSERRGQRPPLPLVVSTASPPLPSAVDAGIADAGWQGKRSRYSSRPLPIATPPSCSSTYGSLAPGAGASQPHTSARRPKLDCLLLTGAAGSRGCCCSPPARELGISTPPPTARVVAAAPPPASSTRLLPPKTLLPIRR